MEYLEKRTVALSVINGSNDEVNCQICEAYGLNRVEVSYKYGFIEEQRTKKAIQKVIDDVKERELRSIISTILRNYAVNGNDALCVESIPGGAKAVRNALITLGDKLSQEEKEIVDAVITPIECYEYKVAQQEVNRIIDLVSKQQSLEDKQTIVRAYGVVAFSILLNQAVLDKETRKMLEDIVDSLKDYRYKYSYKSNEVIDIINSTETPELTQDVCEAIGFNKVRLAIYESDKSFEVVPEKVRYSYLEFVRNDYMRFIERINEAENYDEMLIMSLKYGVDKIEEILEYFDSSLDEKTKAILFNIIKDIDNKQVELKHEEDSLMLDRITSKDNETDMNLLLRAYGRQKLDCLYHSIIENKDKFDSEKGEYFCNYVKPIICVFENEGM